jgi:hypothetical protein
LVRLVTSVKACGWMTLAGRRQSIHQSNSCSYYGLHLLSRARHGRSARTRTYMIPKSPEGQTRKADAGRLTPFFTDELCSHSSVCRKGSRSKFLHQAEEKVPERGPSAATQMNSQTLSAIWARVLSLVKRSAPLKWFAQRRGRRPPKASLLRGVPCIALGP